jgi:hypothetical protein
MMAAALVVRVKEITHPMRVEMARICLRVAVALEDIAATEEKVPALIRVVEHTSNQPLGLEVAVVVERV